ncbi:MAG: hypothetical protein DCC71_15405 [Proteobacteria bacterium]|nr:MAG: hypothetical protein DCC71_15405 [Pseudomonadota bacterium]
MRYNGGAEGVPGNVSEGVRVSESTVGRSVLDVLADAPEGLRGKEVAARCGRKPSSVRVNLERLARRELVACDGDGTWRRWRITAKGRAARASRIAPSNEPNKRGRKRGKEARGAVRERRAGVGEAAGAALRAGA